MAFFNFDQFDTECEIRQMFCHVTNAIDALQNPANANEMLILLEPGTLLQRLMEQLRAGTEEAVSEFNFELTNVITIEHASGLCREKVVN